MNAGTSVSSMLYPENKLSAKHVIHCHLQFFLCSFHLGIKRKKVEMEREIKGEGRIFWPVTCNVR